MRVVGIADLYSGMVLGSDIVLSNNIVFPRHTILTDEKIKELKSAKDSDYNVWIMDLAELKPAVLKENWLVHYYIDFIVSLMHQVFSASLVESVSFSDLSLRLRECITANRNLLYELIVLRSNHCYTFEHSMNVALYSISVGLSMGLSSSELHDLLVGAILHDIGKINISSSILDKNARLTDNEFRAIKQHPSYGVALTDELSCIDSRIVSVIQQHHEKLDGSGYPFKLVDSQINHLSKIVAVCDMFDAIISSRAYHAKRPVIDGINILQGDAKAGKIGKDEVSFLISQLVLLPVNSIVLLSNGKSGVVVEDCKDMETPKILLYEDNNICDLGINKELKVSKVIR